MTNKVSFIYVAQNRFTAVAKTINKVVTKQRVKFRKLGRQVKKTSSEFKKFSKATISGFKGMALAALAFFSIRGFVTKGADFQEALADLSAITGATGKDLDKLTSSALTMSKTFATGGSTILTAFKLVASEKPELLKNTDALIAMTDQVLLLKNASGIELTAAASITAQGLNIFGKSAKDAGKFVNILAAGAKLGSSLVGETGEAMLIAGPAARAAGLDFASLNAVLQATAIGGIKGSRAGTALNAIFGRLRRAGIDFKKVGIEGAFKLVGESLAKISDPTKRAIAESKIFGEEHSKVGLALVTNAKLIGMFEKSLRGTNIAQEQANVNLSTFNAKSRKLGATINAVVIKTFLRLEPILTENINKLSKFFDSIDNDQIDSMADSISGLITGLKVLLDVGVAIASVFKGIGTAIGEFAAQLTTLNFGADISTNLKDAFSIGGKLFGLFGDESAAKTTGGLGGGKSQADVNVNLRAPEKTIESIKTRTTGQSAGLNIGVNMAVAQ